VRPIICQKVGLALSADGWPPRRPILSLRRIMDDASGEESAREAAFRALACGMLRLAILLLLGLFAAPAVAQEDRDLAVTLDGEAVKLKLRVYKPDGDGPFPALIFHHGSTGRGNDPALFANFFDPRPMARWFVERGIAVLLPARRGRGGSEGLYDEGFSQRRQEGYSCTPELSLPGADRALRDIEAATQAIITLPFVDRERLLLGGQSRGGILSVAYAGMRPEYFKGVINFVGGWMGTGCSTATYINTTLMRRGAAYPLEQIWFYADGDPYYPLSHSRDNFDAYRKAGGKAQFLEFPKPQTGTGHGIIFSPDIWSVALEAYIRQAGLMPARAASGGAGR
jgi:dienelactone hydrolase